MSGQILLELAPPLFALLLELVSFPRDYYLASVAEKLLDDPDVSPYVVKDQPGVPEESSIRKRLKDSVAEACRGSICVYSVAPTLIAVVATLVTLRTLTWVIIGLFYTVGMIIFFLAFFTGQAVHEMENEMTWPVNARITNAQFIRYWIILTNLALAAIIFMFHPSDGKEVLKIPDNYPARQAIPGQANGIDSPSAADHNLMTKEALAASCPTLVPAAPVSATASEPLLEPHAANDKRMGEKSHVFVRNKIDHSAAHDVHGTAKSSACK
ncbi:hypothetical protein [Paraburkholderia sp. Ac-20347]|uniref:hypothetical protein n=1 Tax=Paraburkholderia sp. Ac-20347 TaxID=2703892 RepID=UPI001980678A|nr:hypothetical protein [Paraburkholderia sp. Ac-20347]MBN3807832.1 hypothetical protein [Paraburkholderia sp. Ac-20347]